MTKVEKYAMLSICKLMWRMAKFRQDALEFLAFLDFLEMSVYSQIIRDPQIINLN